MKVTKAADVELSGAPSKEQLEKINRLTTFIGCLS